MKIKKTTTEITTFFDIEGGDVYLADKKITIKELLELEGTKICHSHGRRPLLQEITAKAYAMGDVSVNLIGIKIMSLETENGLILDANWMLPIKVYEEDDQPAVRVDKITSIVGDFWEQFGKGHKTISGAAFNQLITIEKILSPKTGEKYDDNMRKFYFAGRVENNGVGKFDGPYQLVDINSAFPAAMIQNHAWGSFFTRTTIIPPKQKFEQSFFQIKCKSNRAFPYRDPKKGADARIEYNNDTEVREYFVTGWELKAAQDLKLVKEMEIIRIYVPTGTRNFKKFVEKFYLQKQKAEKAGDLNARQFAKLILNSAYGKLAQDPRRFEETQLTGYGDMPDGEGWNLSLQDEENGITYWQRKSPGWRYFDVATAASITGCVRAKLLRSINKCTGVVYCDTDSIIAKDVSKLKLSNELGYWKKEKIIKTLWVGGKKLYAALGTDGTWKTASRGVVLSPEEIIEVANGEEVKWRQELPARGPSG